MIGKVMKGDKGYQWVELDEKETKEALDRLLISNMEQADRCFKAVENKYAEPRTELALALFDKQATASFTVLSNALDKKKHDMKQPKANTGFKPAITEKSEEEKKKLEEVASNGFKSVQEENRSLIDEAMKS